MASHWSRVGGGHEAGKAAVLLGLTLHRGDLLPTDLKQEEPHRGPQRRVGGGTNQPDLRLPFIVLWEIQAASYDKGGTHPTAFLPKPCITKKQFLNLSNHPHSLSYFQGSENPGANSETPAETCGIPSSVSTPLIIISPVPTASPSQTLRGPVWVRRARRPGCGESSMWNYRV